MSRLLLLLLWCWRTRGFAALCCRLKKAILLCRPLAACSTSTSSSTSCCSIHYCIILTCISCTMLIIMHSIIIVSSKATIYSLTPFILCCQQLHARHASRSSHRCSSRRRQRLQDRSGLLLQY
jgi:hypothetical protein